MIYIHPAVTHDFKDLVALQQATGLAIDFGKRYLCLVPRKETGAEPAKTIVMTPRRAGKSARLRSYLQGPTSFGWTTPDGPHHPGGGSAA